MTAIGRFVPVPHSRHVANWIRAIYQYRVRPLEKIWADVAYFEERSCSLARFIIADHFAPAWCHPESNDHHMNTSPSARLASPLERPVGKMYLNRALK